MTLRWGFLGAGWIAKAALVPAVHNASNAVLQAVASRDPKRSAAFEPITVHNSYEELLADPNVDAVYIALANHLHCEWSIKALNAGKHVLCEKPLANSGAEARLMADAASANNRLLIEAVWARWHPRYARMVQLVQAGTLGELRTIDTAFTFPGSLEGNYRLDPALGGGSLLDVGLYQVHTWAAVAGADISLAISSLQRNVGPTGVDLTTQVFGKLSTGTLVSAIASFEQPETQRLVLTGSLATLELPDNESFTTWRKASTLRINDTVEDFAPVDAFQVMIEAVGARINGENSWIPNLAESVHVIDILDQIRLHVANEV